MKKNNKGFSLVELVVVIAIMAVLVVVLAPAYLRYVDKTRLQKDVAAVGEVINAVKVAAAEEKVLKQLTHETESENMWTYVKIEKAPSVARSTEKSDKSTIEVGSLILTKADKLGEVQTAITEIIGESVTFARKEVKEARLYIIFAYDDNYNIQAKVDTSVFAEYPDVEAAFKAAFDTTSGAIGANRLADLNDRLNAFEEDYNKFKTDNATLLAEAEASQDKIDRLQALVDVAGNYEKYTNNLKTAQKALDEAQVIADRLPIYQEEYNKLSWWTDSAKKAEYAAKIAAAETAKASLPSLNAAVTKAQTELDNVKAEEQANKDALAAEQDNFNTNYKEVVDINSQYESDGRQLYGEAFGTYAELGVENITSDEFWAQFGQ